MESGDGTANSVVKTSSSDSMLVSQLTLPDLLRQNSIESVDYIKMNIEGAETAVLRGLGDSPLNIRNWCISCHDFISDDADMLTFDFVNSWLATHGYEVTRHPAIADQPWAHFYVYGSKLDS